MVITLQIHFTSLYKVARLPAPASTETLPGTSPMSFAKNIHSFIHYYEAAAQYKIQKSVIIHNTHYSPLLHIKNIYTAHH